MRRVSNSSSSLCPLQFPVPFGAVFLDSRRCASTLMAEILTQKGALFFLEKGSTTEVQAECDNGELLR
jgi:hypothetical protein